LTLTEESSMGGGTLALSIDETAGTNESVIVAQNGLSLSGTVLELRGTASGSVYSLDLAAYDTASDGSYILATTNNVTMTDVSVTLNSTLLQKYFANAAADGDGNITAGRNTAYYTGRLSSTHNGAAGSALLDGALAESNPQSTAAGTDLASLMDQVDAYLAAGNTGAANRLAAALAGSTIPSLGMAQKDALRDQMGYIRNRMGTLGVNELVVNEDLPGWHVWAQATGSHGELDASGDRSGYELNTWGGSVGVDADFTDHVSAGLAFTASWGDYDADGAERASGDLDAYYLNLYGQVKAKGWTHKIVLTCGLYDVKLNRTVNDGACGYRTHGETNGTGFGAMYELNYDIRLNDEGTAVLQPLLGLSVVRTKLDGYAESGETNAGLRVGEQEMTVGTVAVGVRVAGELSEDALGRAARGEFRVNAAQDMGDEKCDADVRLNSLGSRIGNVVSAKEGRTALQIGGGLTVPVGESSSVYFDVNCDIRAHAASVNGSVGYRYDF
ncbi:MAG: autotransporter outer membrane beta-barrel domain-containing protein, partial [Akkermansia sp.]|nr:autotransporter outer membrane beta-barrel domain-containing protein [Akkermansia sp.]